MNNRLDHSDSLIILPLLLNYIQITNIYPERKIRKKIVM